MDDPPITERVRALRHQAQLTTDAASRAVERARRTVADATAARLEAKEMLARLAALRAQLRNRP